MKATDYITHFLEDKKIDHAFGLSGANIEDLYTAIYRNQKTSIVLAKNEYNAATMAIGSYLSTKKMAVVLTTSGPGTLNTLPILAEAYTSKIPFILISGLIPSQLDGYGAFQDTSGVGGTVDLCQMITPCSTFCKKINKANEIPAALENAFISSNTNKRPSVILIPKDIFNQEISDFTLSTPINFISKISKTCPVELMRAINFCREFSKKEIIRPLVILGEELIHKTSMQHLREFIKKTTAAVALTASSKGLFDHKSSQFLGLIGIMGHKEVNDYLDQTDHVILVGSNLEMIHRYGLEKDLNGKHILTIKDQKSSSLYTPIGKSFCEIYGDIENTFASINHAIPGTNSSPIIKKAKKAVPNKKSDLFEMINIINEIQKHIEEDANIFVDAGNSGAFVVHHLKTRGNGTCYVSLGMGGMGNSIGAGIGSSAATGKRTYIFLGDGSFLIHGLEIHTALEYNLPVTFFIFNNNSHGMCSTRETVFQGVQTGINNFKESYFGKGIDSMFPGISSYDVSDLENLKLSLADIKEKNSPVIVSINVSNNEFPPFKTFKIPPEVSK